jgi:hypothetical protein
MKRGKAVGPIAYKICTAVIALMFVAFPVASANAQQPPRQGCLEVSKSEYDIARRKNLLSHRFGAYARTGRLLRRHYWYCT